MTVVVDREPVSFAGVPLRSWAFAVRIWLAVVVALYVGFWLELEAASSAAVTVAILALPSRGQVMQKATFRLFATVVGVVASIAIVGIFAQSGSLFIVACATWLAICVYAVGLLDGDRAYAAALSGYTVAIIAVLQIDNPQHLFESALARGAAITVGILAVTIVNDLMTVPDHHPQLMVQLTNLHREVVGYARRILDGEAVSAVRAAGLLREIVALRPEIASLAAELSDGPARSAAARNVMVGLVAELFAARATKMFTTQLPLREHVIDQLQGKPAIDASPSKALPLDHPDVEPKLAGQLWSLKYLVRTNEEVTRSFGDLSVGRIPRRAWRAPLYRSNRISAASGVRAGAYFLIAAAAFSFSGWPMTYVALSFVAIIVGRGATMPDPRAFTTMAVVGAPIAALMTGILEFVVLDGSTAFPLLAICLAPFIIGAALLVTLPSRIWSALGRFNLIFILVLLAPSNPQTYDPQTFLLSVLLLLLATGLLFVMQMLIPPLSSDRCREWLQASASRDLQNLPSRWQQNLAPEEAMFRDAGRIARFLAAGSNAQEGGDAVEAIMAIFDRSAILRLCDAELDRLKNGPLGIQVGAAREALEARDARSILSSAQALQRAPAGGASATSVSAVLALAGAAFASDHTDFPTDGSP